MRSAANVLANTVDDTDSHIGGRIRRRRRYLGVEQTDFARMLGLTVKVVEKIETGETRIDPWTLFDIAEVLDVCVVEFFEEIAPSNPPGSTGGVDCEETASDDAGQMQQWLTDPESIMLVRAFTSISDPKIRRNFLHLTQAMALE